jgi:hypothetical protein
MNDEDDEIENNPLICVIGFPKSKADKLADRIRKAGFACHDGVEQLDATEVIDHPLACHCDAWEKILDPLEESDVIVAYYDEHEPNTVETALLLGLTYSNGKVCILYTEKPLERAFFTLAAIVAAHAVGEKDLLAVLNRLRGVDLDEPSKKTAEAVALLAGLHRIKTS